MRKALLSIAVSLVLLISCDSYGVDMDKFSDHLSPADAPESGTEFIMNSPEETLKIPTGPERPLTVLVDNPKGYKLSAQVEIKSGAAGEAEAIIDRFQNISVEKERVIITLKNVALDDDFSSASSLVLRIGTGDGMANGSVRSLMDFTLPRIEVQDSKYWSAE